MDLAHTFRAIAFSVLLLAGFPQVAAACDISLHDQVLLIQLGDAVPTPGGFSVSTLRGARLECSTFGPLQIVRPIGAKSFFVLDPHRAFHRWDVTGATFVGDPIAGLEGYVSLYRTTSSRTLWTYYGHLPWLASERSSLAEKIQLSWKPLQLIDSAKYETAIREKLSTEQQEFLQSLSREQVRLSLAVNDEEAGRFVEENYQTIGLYSTEMQVDVSIKKANGIQKYRFLVPVNPIMCPFAGHPMRR